MSAETDAIAARLRQYLEDATPVDANEKTTALTIGELRTLMDEREADKALIAEARVLVRRLERNHLDYEWDESTDEAILDWLAAVQGTI